MPKLWQIDESTSDIKGEEHVGWIGTLKDGMGRIRSGNGSMSLSEAVLVWKGNKSSWKTSLDMKTCLDWML